MSEADIRVEYPEAAIARIMFARGEAGNASRPAMLGQLRDAMTMLTARADVRAIIIAAEGKHFSVGADFAFLDELTTLSATAVKTTVYDNFQGAAKAIYRCPKPTIALVQGAAVTVGCELALACDFRIAADTAMFQESWIKLGIMPPLGGVFLLPRIVGLGRAADMCLRGVAVKADAALAMGLVSEVVAAAALAERGLALARELAATAPLAYAVVKESLHRALETSMDAEWSANLPNQAVLLGSDDFREGLAAARARRAPLYKGH
ncbi:MAG: enoyl-CoA hydratase/isomerase family protein [Polymorphobacter sp.]|jgi:enoyl-CoA hydratase/carnithine racemase